MELDINLVSNMGKVENFIVLGYAKDEKNKLKMCGKIEFSEEGVDADVLLRDLTRLLGKFNKSMLEYVELNEILEAYAKSFTGKAILKEIIKFVWGISWTCRKFRQVRNEI